MNRRIAVAVTLMLASAGIASAQQRGAAAKRDYVVNELSGFNVVLVIGETQRGRSSTENLPEGAARALKEMGEFLPYKSYHVLDAQWTSCCAPKPATTVSGRLQGIFEMGTNEKVVPAQVTYGFAITASTSTANIPVRFVLSAEDPSSRRTSRRTEHERDFERERQDLQDQIVTLDAQIKDMQRRVEVGAMAPIDLRPLQDRQQSLKRRLADLNADADSMVHEGARPVIDSSFTMDAGETVVVGTSKLRGDKALIAIVTAVKKGTSSRD